MPPTRFQRIRGNAETSRVQDNIGHVLDPLAENVGNTPIMGAPPPGWQKCQIQTGWGSPISGTVAPQYHLDALGYFHGQGSISNTTGAPSVAIITNIPMGTRPKTTQVIAVAGGNGTNQQYLIITPKGDVAPGNNVAAGDWLGFTFSFLAEQ